MEQPAENEIGGGGSTPDAQTAQAFRDHVERHRAEERARALRALDLLKRVHCEFAAHGGKMLQFEYSGSGDEGFVDRVIGAPADVWDAFEATCSIKNLLRAAQDILYWHYGAWYDDVGASGTLTVSGAGVTIEHAVNVHAVCESDTRIQFDGSVQEPLSERFIIDP